MRWMAGEPGRGGTPPVPWIQRLLDDEFFLLVVGLMVPVLLYIVWGLMELAQVPLFPQ
ncbi:MAG TPA: hypothetical protein VIL38_08895 [Thermaerobacter sp.]